MPFAPSLSLCSVVSDMFGGGQSLTWRPHWCFALMRLFGSRGACRRHRSCTLGVSKRFGAVSGHLPVAQSVFFGNPQSLFNLVHGIAVDGLAVAHEPPQCWGYSCTGVSIGEQR